MAKIVSLAEKSTDNRKWTTQQMLERLLDDIKSGKENPDSGFFVYWEPNEDGSKSMHYWAVNLNLSEMIMLGEVMKRRLLKDFVGEP